MDKIILAYCRDNADLAVLLDQKLSRVGIPFEHITNQPGAMPGQFAASLQSTDAPVILLVTDNFLKNQNCMASALEAVRRLVQANCLVPVVANGIADPDGDGNWVAVPTQFERVVHSIQYMNFWQSSYLELRARQVNVPSDDMAQFEDKLNIVRDISNEIGEFLNLLRESEFFGWDNFVGNDFAVFFRKFGIHEWHEQYRKVAAFDLEMGMPEMEPRRAVVAPISIPEPRPSGDDPGPSRASENGLPIAIGIENQSFELEPEPLELAESPLPNAQSSGLAEPATWPGQPQFAGMDALVEEFVREENAWENTAGQATRLAADDEFFPASNGQFATQPAHELSNYPANQRILESSNQPINQSPMPDAEPFESAADEAAAVQAFAALDLPEVSDLPESSAPPEQVEVPEIQAVKPTAQYGDFAKSPHSTDDQSAVAFERLGDLALGKNDPLTAKSFWEKCAAADPTYPGIYRKLAKLTDVHLKGHKKSAAELYRLALEQDPNDVDVHFRLATIFLEHLDEPKMALRALLNVVALDPNHPMAWHDLAIAYRETGDPERAESCYRRAIDANPPLRSELNDRLFLQPKIAPVPTKPAGEILTILITGATSGIGRATAEIFAQNGHRLILVGRREERLSELKDSFSKTYGSDVWLLPFDVRDFRAAQAMLDHLPDGWKNIDLLLNNAGKAKGLDPIHEGHLEHWEEMIDTNLKGLLYVTRLVAPGMVARRRGHIINIGSSAGKEVYPKGNVYCATKFAVDALTRAIRLDLHTFGIRVSQVSPGHVEETEFALTRFDGDAERAKIYADFQPLKAADVAEAIYWMATRPAHVNVQDIILFGTQQASATVIDRSGR